MLRVADVERLTPDLQSDAFGDRETAEQAHIQVCKARSPHVVKARGAEADRGYLREGQRIEVRLPADPRANFIDARLDLIHTLRASRTIARSRRGDDRKRRPREVRQQSVDAPPAGDNA